MQKTAVSRGDSDLREKIVVAADSHLRAGFDSALFWDFLGRARAARALYLLGDVFDLWIGDDDDCEFARAAVRRFAEFARGTPLFFARGNHDFLLGADFLRASGARAMADDFAIDVAGRRLLLTHGDLLISDDARYRRLRPLLRSRLLRGGFLRLPLATRRRIAGKIAAVGGGEAGVAPRVCDRDAAAMMRRRDCGFLVMGHTHSPGVFEWRDGGRDFVRFELPAWSETEGGCATIDSDGRIELRAAR